jgi:hypothetical protein
MSEYAKIKPPMKILKISMITLAIWFLFLFGYANLRNLSVGEREDGRARFI